MKNISDVRNLKQWDKLAEARQKHPGKSDEQLDGIVSRRDFLGDVVKGLTVGAAGLSGVGAYVFNSYQRQKEQIYREMEKIDVRLNELQRSIGRRIKIEELESQLVDLRITNDQFREYIDCYDDRLSEELAKLNVKRDEEMNMYKLVIDGFYDYEKNNPDKFALGEGSRVLDLAKAVFPESRGEWESEDYQNYIGSTVLVRSALTGKDLPGVISHSTTNSETGKKLFAYSFMNPNDPMNKIFLDPLRDSEYEPWSVTFDRSRTLSGLSYEDLKKVTHFYVDTVSKPTWANGRKEVAEFDLNGKKTRFYYIPEHF